MDDIFKYAETHSNDYFDMKTGNTFLVNEYVKARDMGVKVNGIRVINLHGETVGVCLPSRNNKGGKKNGK
jgi:hypothetical protein